MISNKYENISLKYMYFKATHDKDNLEKVPLAPPGKIYRFDDILTKVYNKIIRLQKIDGDKDLYTKLKDDYIHHSSMLGDFVNKPSMQNKSKMHFYGKRVVYGVTGENFNN